MWSVEARYVAATKYSIFYLLADAREKKSTFPKPVTRLGLPKAFLFQTTLFSKAGRHDCLLDPLHSCAIEYHCCCYNEL